LSLQSTTTIDVQNEEVSAYKIVDLYTDSSGDNNTVDIGTTTSTYDTTSNAYYCPLSLSTVVGEPSFETIAGWNYTEVDTGSKITGAQDNGWSTDGTYSYKITFGDAPVVGEYGQIARSVNFDNINRLDIDLKTVDEGADTGYDCRVRIYIGTDLIYNASPKPYAVRKLSFDLTAYTGTHDLKLQLYAADTWRLNVSVAFDNIKTYCTDSFVQSVATTISGTYTSAFVRPRLLHPLPSGTSITHEISLDGGANYSSETNDGNIIDLTGLSGTSLICKTHLKTDTNNYKTPMVKGWCVLLW